MLAASNVRSSASALLRWRALVYLLLLLAVAALSFGERATGHRPTPLPTTGGHPTDD